MKITHETRRESFEQLDPSGRKAAILAELERGDGTALEIMRRMGFTDPNRVRPRLNELDRAGYIFQVGKRADPITGVNGVIYSKKPLHPLARITEAQTKNLHLKNTTKRETCQMPELHYIGISAAFDPYAEAEPVSYCPECGAPVYDGERIYYGHGTDHVIGCEHCIDTGFAQAG